MRCCGFVPADVQAQMQVRWDMSRNRDTVKKYDSSRGKKDYFCLSLVLEALGLAPDLDSSRQPNNDWNDSGEVMDE